VQGNQTKTDFYPAEAKLWRKQWASLGACCAPTYVRIVRIELYEEEPHKVKETESSTPLRI